MRQDSPKPESSEKQPQTPTIKHLHDGCYMVQRNVIEASDGNHVFYPIQVNDKTIDGMIDSGSINTFIDESVQLELGITIQPRQHVLKTAGGSGLLVLGSALANLGIKIGKITKENERVVLIAKNLGVPMLVGLDTIRHFELIYYPNDTMGFAEKSLKGVRADRDCIIPAKSEYVTEAKVFTTGSVAIEPFKYKDKLLIANSIDDVKNNKIRVLIVNHDNEPILIQENMQIGSYTKHKDNNDNEKAINLANSDEIPVVNFVHKLNGLNEEIHVGDQLNKEEMTQLERILTGHIKAFSMNGECGQTDLVEHVIELMPNAKPFAEPLRRRAQVQIDETRRQVSKLLDEGIIEESNSPWASAYVLAKKKSGDYRLCIDFRKLNNVTKKTSYPLPNIDDCLDTICGMNYYTKLDFASGFWQIRMGDSSKEMTAFRTEDGLFQFKRMPFGLTNAPASFQRMMNALVAGLKGLHLQVFIDDVCIATKNWAEHISTLDKFLKVVIKSNLKLKASKCIFGAAKIVFLGHEISKQGIRQDPDKLKAIEKLPQPTNPKEVQRVMGLLNYYRKFVPNFAILAEPLTRLTRKNVEFKWTNEQEIAFRKLINCLLNNATLAHYNHVDPLLLKTDASKKGVAGMLLQKQDGEWKIVTCCSRRLSSAETNYGITDLEGLAVIYSTQKLKPYLLGKQFKIILDHCALCVLNKRTPHSSRLRRWAILLSEFDFEIIYTKGNLHQDIDCLSRAPVNDENDNHLDKVVYAIFSPRDNRSWVRSYEKDDESKLIYEQAKSNSNSYKLVNNIIYYGNKLFVPKDKRNEIMAEGHDNNTSGHGGILATQKRLESYYWPDMVVNISDYVKSCHVCQVRKVERSKPSGEMRHFITTRPFQLVAIDTLGPVGSSLKGKTYIIVAIDVFTKFMETKALVSVKADECAEFLIDYCARFGPPEHILTDNATQFDNKIVKDVLKLFGIKHRTATPEHSQSNAPVERAISTLQEKIAIALANEQTKDNWDVVLPVITQAINSTYHTSTKHTPYELVFGRKLPLISNLAIEQTTVRDLHLQLIQSQLKQFHEEALSNQLDANVNSRKYFNSKEVEFNIGDLCMSKEVSRRNSKFGSRYKGPYKIIARNNDVYKIESLANNKIVIKIKQKEITKKIKQKMKKLINNNRIQNVSYYITLYFVY